MSPGPGPSLLGNLKKLGPGSNQTFYTVMEIFDNPAPYPVEKSAAFSEYEMAACRVMCERESVDCVLG